MVRRQAGRPPDSDVQAILDGLEVYKAAHPYSRIESCRQNSASIRIRIIDPDFGASNRVTRDEHIWEILAHLPEQVQSQITVLLLLTPEDIETSFANMDFEHPIPSKL